MRHAAVLPALVGAVCHLFARGLTAALVGVATIGSHAAGGTPQLPAASAAPADRPRLVVQLGQFSSVLNVDLSPDGRLAIATGSEAARLYETATGRQVRDLAGQGGQVVDAVFTPDGRHVLTAGQDRTAALWDVATGERMRTFSGHQR